MKVRIVLTLIIGLSILVSGQERYSNISDEQFSKEICSAVVEGLKLCAISPVVLNSGENVVLNLTLKNMLPTNRTITTTNIFDRPFVFTVSNEKGARVLSKIESLQEQKKNGTISTEDSSRLFELCCVNTLGSISDEKLAGKQIIHKRIDLSVMYDLNTAGNYFVEVTRKVANQDKSDNIELSLPGISVEVK